MTSISSLFNKTELTLLHSLKLSLRQTDSPVTALSLTEKDWEQVITLADRHEVLALLTPVLDLDRLSQKQQLMVESKTARTIQKGIQLQALNARLTGLLEKEGIIAVTLKGCAVARLYPVAEYRKTTDIDLFVENREAVERALLGEDYSKGALYFVSKSSSSTWFRDSLTHLLTHGDHLFYK